MKRLLKPGEVANLVGIDEAMINRAVRGEDPEIASYIERKEGEILIDIAGIPAILKKLAFNMPTTEIIENLACQILHLEVISQKYEELRKENHQLRAEIMRLRSALSRCEENLADKKSRFSSLLRFRRKT